MMCEGAERIFVLKTRLRPLESIDGVSVAEQIARVCGVVVNFSKFFSSVQRENEKGRQEK